MSILRKYIREVIEDEAPSIQPESIIYCDMDGVLVDFAQGAITLANTVISGDRYQGWVDQSKSMRRALRDIEAKQPGFEVKTSKDLDIPEVRTLMFAAIGFNPGEFFSQLPPLHDGLNTLWKYITSTSHSVSLLTAPVGSRKGVESMTAGEGKKMWANEWLRPSPGDVIISPARQKPDYAITNGIPNILIDDKASTITSWNERGGIGILHVTGNSERTIAELRRLGI